MKDTPIARIFTALSRFKARKDAAERAFDAYTARYWRAGRVFSKAWKRRRDEMWRTDSNYCRAYNMVLSKLRTA